MKECSERIEYFPHRDIMGGKDKTKQKHVVWIVIPGSRQTPHSGGSKVIFLHPFYVFGRLMSYRKAAATGAVPMGFLESTWPLFTSAARHLDSVSGQQAWHWNFCGARFAVHQGWSPKAREERFLTLAPFSQSPSWEGGHLLTIRKTEALNCASHPQWTLGSEPWQHEVQSTVHFLSPALCGECGWPTAEKKETNTLG